MSTRNSPAIWKELLLIPRSELGKFRRKASALHVQKVRCAHGDKKGPAHEVAYYANGRISCLNHSRKEVREALQHHKVMRQFGAEVSKERKTCFDFIIAQKEDYERRRSSDTKGTSYVPKVVRELEWARHGTPSCVTRALTWGWSDETREEERAALRAEGYNVDRAHPRVVEEDGVWALREQKSGGEPFTRMGPAEFQIWSSLMEVPILRLPGTKLGWAPFGLLLGAQLARSARLLRLGAYPSWRVDSLGRVQVKSAGDITRGRGRLYSAQYIFLLDAENHCVWTPTRGDKSGWRRASGDSDSYTWIPMRWDGKDWRGGAGMNPPAQPQLMTEAFRRWMDWEIIEAQRTKQAGGPTCPRPAQPDRQECSELERNLWPVWNRGLLKLTDLGLFRIPKRKAAKKTTTKEEA